MCTNIGGPLGTLARSARCIRFGHALLVVVALSGTASELAAFAVGPMDVWSMLADADEVWRGAVLDVAFPTTLDQGPEDARVSDAYDAFRIRVVSTIKGSASPGETTVVMPTRLRVQRVRPGQHFLFFVKRTDQGAVAASRNYLGMLVPATAPSAASTASPEDALVAELLHALTSTDREIVLEAIRQVGNSGRADLAASIESMLAHDDARVVGTVHEAILALGDLSQLADCVGFLEQRLTDAEAVLGQIAAASSLSSLATRQAGEMAAAYDDQTGNRLLVALAEALPIADPYVRRFLAMTVRKLAEEQDVLVLMELLEEHDPETQYQLIQGLYHAVRGWENAAVEGYAPTVTVFMERPEHYVGLWQTWWEQGGPIEPRRDQYGDPVSDVKPRKLRE